METIRSSSARIVNRPAVKPSSKACHGLVRTPYRRGLTVTVASAKPTDRHRATAPGHPGSQRNTSRAALIPRTRSQDSSVRRR